MSIELVVAIDQCPANVHGEQARLARLEETLLSCADKSVDLVIYPELFQCGYDMGERVYECAETSDGRFFAAVSKLAKQYHTAVIYGYAERARGSIYNSAQCIDKTGNRIGHHRKLVLPPGSERQYFSSGERCQIFTLGAVKVAVLICYDAEFAENVRQVALNGADLVVVPTALGSQWGVVAEKVMATRAFENGVFIGYANYCEQDNTMAYYGGSCLISPSGADMARAGRESQLLVAKLCIADVTRAQSRLPYLQDRKHLNWL